MQNCISSIESCTQDIVRFNERVEQNRVQAQAQRQENGDPVVARKAMIPMVFIILSWVFVAFVWRVCSRLIQQNPAGAILGTRSEGIGLLVGFVILWMMSIWSYVVVISKGPGLVKDYVAESDPPPAAAQGGWNGAPAPAQPYAQGSSEPIAIPGAANGDAAAHAPATSLPYPSFNADLERFGGHRASADSMRVLPGSVEPNLDHSVDVSHAPNMSSSGPVDHLATEPPPPTDDIETTDPAADPALPGILGPLAAAAMGEGHGVREGAEAIDQANAAPVSGPSPGDPTSSGWAPPQRRPQNDPPPLSPAALYCHRCRRIKPPRAHHCRRCGVCVLKMDHHCPWVGGCVGAHNQRFFFTFVLWVTLLELYTLISTAIYFHRGIRSLSNSGAWRVDGYLISLFPICAVFLIFTGALLGTHIWLMAHNLTTIEHVGVNRMQGRERVLVDRWFATQASGSGGKVGGLNLKQKRKMVRGWDREWGRLTGEGNRWWLGSTREAQWESEESEKQDAGKQGGKGHGAFRTNMGQALGESVWLWVLPLGKHPNDGLSFPMNPRFGEQGVWRKRDEWPAELR
uniref:Palmitoyltransferase n=2 Tax=Kalmanozyma brasiliensis (strain GHG001) TaxID=1365824 RepID=V5GP88_KALBG